MSDSDSELLTTSNAFTFQNESTTVSARGPNISTTNVTGLSFRPNILTSTMNMPRKYDWHRRAESIYDQRSIGYRRETSPISIASACDARLRNSSQRSVYNGRGGSPMSIRSIDSNATVSAKDIAMALNSTQFSKYDSRILQEACNRFMKHKARKGIEKRRNRRLLLKNYRRKSGNDSGELGSNSSISSDDDRSTWKQKHKNNMSSSRSTKSHVSDFRRTITESNIITDCTSNFKQNRLLGMVGRSAKLNTSISSISSSRSMIEKQTLTKLMPPPNNYNKAHSQNSMMHSMIQRDRFKNGFLLPSQRFNRSVAATSIPETAEKHPLEINKTEIAKAKNKGHYIQTNSSQDLNSDEEIFSEITTVERPTKINRKRSNDSDDDICLPNSKKTKVASPCKNMSKSFKNSTAMENVKNDFKFAKPAHPVRKSANLKAKEKIISTSANINAPERLISKSPALLPKQANPIPQPKEIPEHEIENEVNTELSSLSQNTTDLSMRPSFIKRKLFSQNMDVTEKTNDVLATNSPQNSFYGAVPKEKNKVRKLVTSQYYLTRDIDTNKNNLLDLIHKIVPAEHLNAINQTNKTVVSNDKPEKSDNWDVSGIISTRNNDDDDDMSDTFTDEDTLNTDNGKAPLKVTTKKMEETPPKVKQAIKKVLVEKNGPPNNVVQKYVNSFWDTDFESDVESTKTPATRRAEENKIKENQRGQIKENKKNDNSDQTLTKPNFKGFSSMFPVNKTSLTNNTLLINNAIDNNQRFNNINRSLTLCSHRNNKPKKTAPEKFKDAKLHIEPLTTKQKTLKVSSCVDLTKQEDITEPCNKKNKKQDKSKPERPKSECEKSPPKKRKPNKDNDEVTTKVAKENDMKTNNKPSKIISDEKKEPKNNKKTVPDQSKKEPEAAVQHQRNSKKTESQNKKGTVQNKPNSQSKKEPDAVVQIKRNSKKTESQNKKEIEGTVQNKPNHQSPGISQNKTSTKKDAKANQKKIKNKNERDANIIQNTDKTVNSYKSPNNSKNKKAYCKKTDSIKLNMKNIQEPMCKNANVSKLTDSMIYEDSFTETSNKRVHSFRSCQIFKQNESLNTTKSNRPVRSCRAFKQNESLNTTKSNRPVRSCRAFKQNESLIDTSKSLNISLRSREASKTKINEQPLKNKLAKNTNKTNARIEQSALSDLSFSLAKDKKTFFKSKEIDTSDVSFSLNKDKESPLLKYSQGHSALSKKKKEPLLILQRINMKDINSSGSKPVRNRLANRRYI